MAAYLVVHDCRVIGFCLKEIQLIGDLFFVSHLLE